MPTFALRDVDPLALTLCKVGANRQRIFLRKTIPGSALIELPAGRMPILKEGEDWTVFYCCVAEPGAEEDPGLVGEQGSTDVWESEDEIRKAAHRLLKNAAFVNSVHDGEATPGCAIVESAVALADLKVSGATIKKGSWYVGIEPNAEARAQIDAGEIEAISLEGSGVRVPIEKSASFAEVIGAQQMRDALWRATSTLEDVIFSNLRDEDEADPKAVIRRSLDEFVAYLAPMLDSVTGDGRAALAKQLGTLGSSRTASSTPAQEDEMGLTEDFAALKKSHDDGRKAIVERLEKSDETTGALIGLVGKLTERVEALASGTKAPEEKADAETAVKKLGEALDQLDALDGAVAAIAKSVKTLAQGDTSQTGQGDQIQKTGDPDRDFALALLG